MANVKNISMLAQLDMADLQRVVADEIGKIKHEAFLNRFENVMVGVKDVAHIHGVSGATVTNYINDGAIIPEIKLSENEHPKFRLSYVLTLDFQELKKDLIARNKGWKS